MSRLGTTLLAKARAVPKGSVTGLIPILRDAGNLTDATNDEVHELVGVCVLIADRFHGAVLTELRSCLNVGLNPPGFPNLKTSTIVCQAAYRLFDPGSLAQLNTETCGPVSFIIDLCRQRPMDYVRILKELLLRGQTKVNDLEIAPSENVRFRNPDRVPIAQVDWVMVGSLRDSLTGLNIYGVASLFQNIEDTPIMPEDLFSWLRGSGYGRIALLGVNSRSDFRSDCLVRRAHGKSPSGFEGFPLSPEGIARLAEKGSDDGWSVFLFVDDRVSDALNKGTIDFETRYALNARDMPSQIRTNMIEGDKARLKSAARDLQGEIRGGHVMLVAEIKLGFYASLTAFNRGRLVYNHTLPKDRFFPCLKSAIIATDRIN